MPKRRRHWSKVQRLKLHEEHLGICHICGEVIDLDTQAMDVEHVIPLAMGGADEWRNVRPAHRDCHAAKTKTDVTQIAKAKRVNRKHTNNFRPPRNVVPGSKASRFQKKLDGTVINRITGEKIGGHR